jgi:drug/metabolite transporter (DMT)-like permease
MNSRTIVAAILVVVGVVVLAYSGINFSTPGQPVNFLGMHIQTTENHFIPPVVGAVALAAGVILFVMGNRGRTA